MIPTRSGAHARKEGGTMFVSQTLLGYLDRSGVDFDLLTHPHSGCSHEIARAARIAARQLAKGVLMRGKDYMLAVVPASRHVNAFALSQLMDGELVTFAQESEMPFIFRDCERGAVPIVGDAFGVRTAVDDALLACDDVYFEAGDHERLVHLRHDAFTRLMQDQPHGEISY
jgi:Ala-tRNA(Pro) deacylase